MATKFRTSFTHKEGHDRAIIYQGRITNINLVKWTVDVVARFDRIQHFNIQVGTNYLHHANGEGIYPFPEVGATCMVCIPSDSAPPFVMAFVMPSEVVDDSSSDAPLGTTSHGQTPAKATDASFAGGRPNAAPGDIWMRTRDGNFVILHRGGVLQVGATELAQRIYIPLNNLITDISQNYEHHNSNGSIVWGLQNLSSQAQVPSQFMETFRVFATDQYADIKLACGKVYNPVPEPDGGANLSKAGVGAGDDGKGKNPIIFEVTVSPKGFITQSGDVAGASTVSNSVLKFTFDRTGNALLRCEGNLFIQVKKQLTLSVSQDISIETSKGGRLKSATGMTVDGGSFTEIKGSIVRLGAGQAPVARVGDIVQMTLAASPLILTFASMPVPGAPSTCTVSTPAPLIGSVASGNNQVLA